MSQPLPFTPIQLRSVTARPPCTCKLLRPDAEPHGLKSTSPQCPHEGVAVNRVSIMATTFSPDPFAVSASTSASR